MRNMIDTKIKNLVNCFGSFFMSFPWYQPLNYSLFLYRTKNNKKMPIRPSQEYFSVIHLRYKWVLISYLLTLQIGKITE